MKNKLTTAIFLNHCFDKRRFQSFLYWFFKKSHSGQSRLLNFLEKLKFLGFHSATQAGFSMSIDDLKIPSPKSAILSAAENIVFNADLHLISGHLTTIERYQRILEIWNRTSEKLKYQVLQSFQISDFFNPVYLMAFSGARGNISQIRQLVGMRGLMADPQGKIIDFPIRSNFREGLTLTEYLISCSGARKGIVDTALRTAASGYLTRRLVDVAHHVIISQIDCQQNRRSSTLVDFSKTSQCGIWIEALYDQQKEILPLQQRLVGRILAETITFPEKSLVIGIKDQEITQITSQKICKYRKKVLIRSPLTCQSSKFICQLCYGWNLSEGQLVSVGEAVGVLAAQSIGEPGTQLTMRTFHTGGVFTGRLIDQTYAPFFGTVHYNSFCNGLLIRTLQGRIAYLSKNNGILSINQSKKRTQTIARIPEGGARNPEGPPAKRYSHGVVPFLRNGSLKAARRGKRGAGVYPMAKAQAPNIPQERFSYFILEKLRFTFDQLGSSQFKVKFELKPIYSNFVSDPMTDFKAKNKSYFQKIKNSPLLCKPLKYSEITGFSHQARSTPFLAIDLPHSQAFVDQFKKLSCQLKGMISLNQTWLTSNKKKLTNTGRFNLNFIFNISQIYQKKLQKYHYLYGKSPKGQASKKIGWSRHYWPIHLQDQAKYPFEKQIRFVFQIFTLLYVRQGENVLKTQLIAELPFFENEKSLENEQEILSNESGEVYFENFIFLEKTRSNLKTGSEITKIIKDYVQGLGEFWILFGRSFQHLLTTKKLSFFRKFDLIDSSIPFAQIQIEPHNFLTTETSDLVLQSKFIQLEQVNLFSRRKKITLSKIQNSNNFSTTHLIFKPGFWSCRFLQTSFHQQSRFFKPVNKHWIQDQLQTGFSNQTGFLNQTGLRSKIKKEVTLILQKFSRTFQIHLIFFKNSGYLQIYNIQALPSGLHGKVFDAPSRLRPPFPVKRIGFSTFVDTIFWKDRKNYQKLLNKSFETWMIGLQRQSKYIPKYSDFRQQFFKISRKHFYLQFLKTSHSNFHPMSFLNLQKQKRNFFFSDTSFRIRKNSQKFFCEFQNQILKPRPPSRSPLLGIPLQGTPRFPFVPPLGCRSFGTVPLRGSTASREDPCACPCAMPTPGENQIGARNGGKKMTVLANNRIKLPFFFHENTCILLVNRQGISQFFGQEIIQNSDTFNSISRYWMNFPTSPILFLWEGSPFVPPLGCRSFGTVPLRGSTASREETGRPHLSPRGPKNKKMDIAAKGSVLKIILSSYLKSINFQALFLNLQVFGFCKVSFRIGTKKCWRVSKISKNQLPKFFIKMPSKKNLNVYHWLSNSIEKSNHLWLFKYPLVSLQFFKGSPLRARVQQENIQSVFCTVFLKQSKLFQNLPKNWARQITNAQPKIIHWADLPFQKYIFLISFLKEVGKLPGNLYKFIQPKNFKNVVCMHPFQKLIGIPGSLRESPEGEQGSPEGETGGGKGPLKGKRAGKERGGGGRLCGSKKFYLKNFNNFDWKIQFWKIQQRQDRIGYSKWKIGSYSFIRIFFCIGIPSFKSIQWFTVNRLEPKYLSKNCFSTAKLSLIFDPAVKYRSYPKSLPSCFKNLFHRFYLWEGNPIVKQIKQWTLLQLNLTKLFLKNRYRQQVNTQYQSSLFRQKIRSPKKFLFNKEKLSTDDKTIDPKNRTLFSNFLVPKQNNEKLISPPPLPVVPFRGSLPARFPFRGPFAIQDFSIQSSRKHTEARKEIILNRLEKLDQYQRGFSIYTGLWTSKFRDFSDLRFSFPGDEKLKNNFQNIQLGSPNELLGIFDAPENQFDISCQWKFFGDCVTIMEQKLYPTYFQNFSSQEASLNVKRDRVFQKRIESFSFDQTSIVLSANCKTQIQNRFCTVYPSLDEVLKQFELFQTSTTNNWLDEISETSVFLLDKILPKSLCSLESGTFKNRILPFYNQIESSKLQKCILDVYFGSYCQILQNFSLFKNFTSRFSQNQPKKPIYNMFSVTMVDTIQTQLLSKSKYNFENKIQKIGSKIKASTLRAAGLPGGFRPKFKNSNLFSVSAFDVLRAGLSNRNRLRVRIERFDQCLKTKFHNSGLSNQKYPDLPIGKLNPVVYQIHIGSNNKNKLNQIFNDIFGSNYSIQKNTINLQKYDIQNFFEYQTHFHNFYIEYISKKSSRFDDFYQIRNFHKFNMKSWLNRTKNFQKYSIRYLKSKLISKKLNLFIKNSETLLREDIIQIPDLSHKKILNKTLFLIQQQESQQSSMLKPISLCCFILKFSKKNWDNFYSINLSHYFFSIQTSPYGQNRKFFRIPLILNPKPRTSNQKNITLNNFFASKHRSKTNLFKLHFRILTIIQTLLFVYRYYNIILGRSDQNITRLTLRSRSLTALALAPNQAQGQGQGTGGGHLAKSIGRPISNAQGFQLFPRTTLKKEYFNGFGIRFLFPSHLKFPIFYIPLFDQSHEIFLTSIIPLTLNFNPLLPQTDSSQYKTSISDAIPKIWDQTHFLKIHIIQTKRLDFLNLIVKNQYQYCLNSENKDVCNFQIIKKNDLKSFEMQIFIRFFFPFHLGEIVDLSQKTKSLLLTNIEDFFSYHNHWLATQNTSARNGGKEREGPLKGKRAGKDPLKGTTGRGGGAQETGGLKSFPVPMHHNDWTDLNIQNYKPPFVWDEFFNLFYLQPKNKTKRNFANTFTLKNKPVLVPLVNPVSKVQQLRKGLKLYFKLILGRRSKIDLSIPIHRARNPQGRGGANALRAAKFVCLGANFFTLCDANRKHKPHPVGLLSKRKGDREVLSTPILINKHLRPSFQKNILNQNQGTIQAEHSLLGSLMRGGQEFNDNQNCFAMQAGQFIAKTGHIFLYRKATTHLLNNQSILHVQHGEIISKNQRLCSVFYSQSKTGDIVQGIPKIEEIFEARKKSKYSLHELPIFSKDFLFFEKKITKYLQSLQKSVVNSIQKIYCGQGIHISDKHIEIIVRQMTSNVIILEPGQTGLLCGEIVALQWIARINSLFTSNQVIYEPIFLGMTKTCLETSSFLSAASFQETTRILSRAALQNQIDFIRGLKQNVILGNLIPIGTGYFK